MWCSHRAVVTAARALLYASGFRLGYGGGYFDRWLAAHPHVTVIGVAWSVGEVDEAEWQPQPHDRRLDCVVSELGVC